MDCCLQCLEFQVVVSCVSYNTRHNKTGTILGWKVLFAGFQVKLV